MLCVIASVVLSAQKPSFSMEGVFSFAEMGHALTNDAAHPVVWNGPVDRAAVVFLKQRTPQQARSLISRAFDVRFREVTGMEVMEPDPAAVQRDERCLNIYLRGIESSLKSWLKPPNGISTYSDGLNAQKTLKDRLSNRKIDLAGKGVKAKSRALNEQLAGVARFGNPALWGARLVDGPIGKLVLEGLVAVMPDTQFEKAAGVPRQAAFADFPWNTEWQRQMHTSVVETWVDPILETAETRSQLVCPELGSNYGNLRFALSRNSVDDLYKEFGQDEFSRYRERRSKTKEFLESPLAYEKFQFPGREITSASQAMELFARTGHEVLMELSPLRETTVREVGKANLADVFDARVLSGLAQASQFPPTYSTEADHDVRNRIEHQMPWSFEVDDNVLVARDEMDFFDRQYLFPLKAVLDLERHSASSSGLSLDDLASYASNADSRESVHWMFAHIKRYRDVEVEELAYCKPVGQLLAGMLPGERADLGARLLRGDSPVLPIGSKATTLTAELGKLVGTCFVCFDPNAPDIYSGCNVNLIRNLIKFDDKLPDNLTMLLSDPVLPNQFMSFQIAAVKLGS